MPAGPDDAPARAASAPVARRRARSRSIISARWLTTLLAIACAALWLLTLWAWPGLSTRWFAINIAHGIANIEQTDLDNLPQHELVALTWTPLADLPGYDFRYRIANFQWLPHAGATSTLNGLAKRWYLDLPLWMPFILFSALAVKSWRTHIIERKSPTRCHTCNYDLKGLPANAPCPECGGVRPLTPPSRQAR
jgi:hypothetical protein